MMTLQQFYFQYHENVCCIRLLRGKDVSDVLNGLRLMITTPSFAGTYWISDTPGLNVPSCIAMNRFVMLLSSCLRFIL